MPGPLLGGTLLSRRTSTARPCRDEGESYSMIWTHASTEAGEYVVALRNTSSTGKTMVISAVGVNSVLACTIRAHFVAGTAAGGNAVVPTNLNRTSNNDAAAVGHEGGAASAGITGLTAVADTDKIDRVQCPAAGHEQLRFDDRVRLGQNDGFALEVETVASASNTFGVVFFYYE